MALNAATIDRLKSQLLTSGLSQQNQALFQVINQLIDAVRGTAAIVEVATGGGGGVGVLSQSFLTTGLEQGSLANSRQVRPGSGITFMDDGIHVLISALIPQGLDGQDGEQGLIGSIGPQGQQGIQGPIGPPGLDGECYCEPMFPVATTLITGVP